MPFLRGVVLFALISFLFDQIFSEKVQNVANNLKIVWKKFGEHILDLLEKIPFFLKKILHFCINLEIIWKKSIFKNCILNLTIQKSCRFSVFIQRIIYWILLFDWFRKKIEVRRNTFGQHLLTKWYEYIFSHKFQWKSKFLLRAGDLQILKVLIIPFQVWWIPPDRVSFLLKTFEWIVMHNSFSKSWYFTYKHISFKSRNVLMMRFGIFIYPPNTKKVKAFWYLLNWYV